MSTGGLNEGYIREFYRDRNVLVTGGTGFLGKIIIEKLLRSCADIGTVYVIIRAKKGSTAEERLQRLLSEEVFGRLHDERPLARNKVVAIEADLSGSKCDMSERDRAILEKLVSVVFHSAATVKLEDGLKNAVKLNIGGTKCIVDLAKNMNNLKAFVHISSAYSNCDRLVIEEKYYQPQAPDHFWQDILHAAEAFDENVLNALTPRLIGNHPNNYTFTKHLAESLVHDQRTEIPVVIFRPSIIIGAFREPYPGWVDNLNGPIALVVGYITGFMRLILANSDTKPNYISVDYVANGAIAASWQRGLDSSGQCPVYNCCTTTKHSISIAESLSILSKARYMAPTEKTIWKPRLAMTTSLDWFRLNFILCNVLPAFIFDITLKIRGINFSAVRACRKIFTMCRVVTYFTMTTFDFKNDKFKDLYEALSAEDKKIFDFHMVDGPEYYKRIEEMPVITLMGIKRFMLKDNMSQEYIEKVKRRMKYYDWADTAVRTIVLAYVIKIAWSYVQPYYYLLI